MVLPRMSITINLGFMTWLVLVMTSLGPILVRSEPDSMARPTRPKVFTSVQQLRRYLDLVRDYYSLNGKARYGKRTPILPPASFKCSLDISQMLFNLRQPSSQITLNKQRGGKRQQKKLQDKLKYLQLIDFQQLSVGTQQTHFHDIVTKYYDRIH